MKKVQLHLRSKKCGQEWVLSFHLYDNETPEEYLLRTSWGHDYELVEAITPDEAFAVAHKIQGMAHDSIWVDEEASRRTLVSRLGKTISDLPANPNKPALDPSAIRDRDHMPAPVRGPTPFDPFKGFKVSSGATPGRDTVEGLKGDGGHALQRMTDGDTQYPAWKKLP